MKKLIYAIYDRYFFRGTISTVNMPTDEIAALLNEPLPEK